MAFAFIIAQTAHPEACLAEGMPILVQGDAIREAVYGAPSLIEVDQRVNPPVFKQTVGGEIVVCGIQAEVCRRDAKFMGTKSVYRVQEVNTVMTFGTGKIHQEWELRF